MGSYKVEQRHLTHRGREFHFVSYDAREANQRRGEEELPAMWFVMSSGNRVPVMPQIPDQDEEELDSQLVEWLDQNVFAKKRRSARSA